MWQMGTQLWLPNIIRTQANGYRRAAIRVFGVAFLTVAISISAGAANAGCGPDNVSGQLPGPAPWASEFNAAETASKNGDYDEALRILQDIDSRGEAGATTLPSNYPWRELVIGKQVYVLAYARVDIGVLYEKGLGVPQNYSEAAKWYEKALNTGYCGTTTRTAAALNLGRLYLYGKGVPESKAKAREIWVQGSLVNFVRLLDASALPRTLADWDHFDVNQAVSQLNAKEAAKSPPPAVKPADQAKPQPGKGLPIAAKACVAECQSFEKRCKSPQTTARALKNDERFGHPFGALGTLGILLRGDRCTQQAKECDAGCAKTGKATITIGSGNLKMEIPAKDAAR